MKEDIRNYNEKQDLHGYQEWYGHDKIWLRGTAKNGEPICYEEIHENKFSKTNFYIG